MKIINRLKKTLDSKIKEFLLKDLELSIRYGHMRNQILKIYLNEFKENNANTK